MKTEIYSLTILESAAGRLSAEVRYDAAHPVFEGHFPGNPIVPGVCTLDMISDTLRDQIGGGLQLESAANVKFLQLIRPGDVPLLMLSWNETNAQIEAQATLESGGAAMMRFSGKYRRL
jgi:3-hydroxyacyl-[acyl-carrier-protein] dehydratase